jgi:excisionase family DNA binding protein
VGGLRDKGERRTGEALLSTEEVAEYWGVGRVTVYRWCKEGRTPCLKVGKL